MAQSYFVWNNVDCRAKGILLSGPVSLVRPEERVEHITIPGRSGDLTSLEGTDIYNSYIQTATILVHGGYRGREIFNWLKGSGYVTFSGEPDRRQKARIIGAITLNKHAYNLDWWTGEVQFYCDPMKEKLSDPAVVISSSPGNIRNNGDTTCRPLYKVTASGVGFTFKVTGTNTPDVDPIAVTDITSGSVYWVDSEQQAVWNEDMSTNMTVNSSGVFPVIGIGDNQIIGDGFSTIEVQRRERFL